MSKSTDEDRDLRLRIQLTIFVVIIGLAVWVSSVMFKIIWNKIVEPIISEITAFFDNRTLRLQLERQEKLRRKIAPIMAELRREMQLIIDIKFDKLHERISKLEEKSKDLEESIKILKANLNIEELEYSDYKLERESNLSTIIAVDATPIRGGGLLYYPAGKTLICYSIDWTDYFEFQFDDSDKFEMVNSLLAVELFTKYFRNGTYFTADDVHSVTLKVDNTFILDGYKKLKNSKFRAIYDEIKNLLRLLHSDVTMQYTKHSFDAFIRSADKLSRNNEGGAVAELTLNGIMVEKWLTLQDWYVRGTLFSVASCLKSMSKKSGEVYSFLLD